MADEPNVVGTTETPVIPVKEPEKEVDLITRVSQVKPEPPKDAPKVPDGEKFNINNLDEQINTIQDPTLKEQFVNFKKSLLRGENQKYEEIANLRKEYENKLAASNANWTPERLKQELNKPDFVQAANTVLNTGNPTQQQGDDQYSALSDGEKAEIRALKQKLDTLEQSNWNSVKTNQDATLSDKYANYDPNSIDKITTDLMQGKVQATREDLWKVIDYNNAVQRAYELGLSDKKEQNQERADGMSHFDGGGSVTPSNAQMREKGETTEQFMRRSYAVHAKKQ